LEQPVPGRRAGCGNGHSQQTAHRHGEPSHPTPQTFCSKITIISPKQLVATITREAHGDILTGQLRNQKGGYLRGIAKGFVIDPRQARYHIQRLLGGDLDFVVLSPQMSGDLLGMSRFVEGGFPEPHDARHLRTAGFHVAHPCAPPFGRPAVVQIG
jgi:hypothetical protein